MELPYDGRRRADGVSHGRRETPELANDSAGARANFALADGFGTVKSALLHLWVFAIIPSDRATLHDVQGSPSCAISRGLWLERST